MRLVLAPEVAAALANRQAVVALESTVISHGLPYPLNLQTAKTLEATVRAGGAIPATIAILDGVVKVGLVEADLERLAKGGVDKASLWNLPTLLARGGSGGTTVAATVHLARTAGIEVFATGGIGGVHHDHFDESADLPALARTSCIVVCAGPKSILNLAATLERLETLGIPVVGYGTDFFPAFHSPSSPFRVPGRCDTPEQVARTLRAAQAMSQYQAILVTNPLLDGLPFDQVQAWVETATHEAREQGIGGKNLTPFLLRRLSELSDGETDRANERLLAANALLGAKIAVALRKL
jgi:pseudouridylate synthase